MIKAPRSYQDFNPSNDSDAYDKEIRPHTWKHEDKEEIAGWLGGGCAAILY